MPKPVWEQNAEDADTEYEVKADSFLDWLKASKWTAALLVGLAVIIVVMVVKIL